MNHITVKPIKGTITLDRSDHKYLVDGIKIANQISVTQLINSNYKEIPQTKAMIAGTQIHEEMSKIIKDKFLENGPYSDQAFLLKQYYDRIVRRRDSRESSCIHNTFERCFGVEIVYKNQGPFYLFGSVDCLANTNIIEFKTAAKDYPTYKWQVNLYKLMLIARNEGYIWSEIDVFICHLNGIVDYSNVTEEETLDYLERKMEQYLLLSQPVKPDVEDATNLVDLYCFWRQKEEEAKIAKEKLDSIIKDSIPQEGQCKMIVGGVKVQKTSCFRTSYDSELIKEKLPEALKMQEYYRTIYSIDRD